MSSVDIGRQAGRIVCRRIPQVGNILRAVIVSAGPCMPHIGGFQSQVPVGHVVIAHHVVGMGLRGPDVGWCYRFQFPARPYFVDAVQGMVQEDQPLHIVEKIHPGGARNFSPSGTSSSSTRDP